VARAISTFGAAILLVSQLIGAAHFHESVISSQRTVAAQADAVQGLCPVCQLAFHSPGSVTAAPAVAHGPVIAEPISLPETIRAESPACSTARVRAPPATL
jgi:hypothetical protein